jgi:hypothetical protein
MGLKKLLLFYLRVFGEFAGQTFLNGQIQDQSQKQENESGKEPENRKVISNLLDEVQSYSKSHEKHRTEKEVQQLPNQLGEMQDNDPSHPYSAYRPEEAHSYSDAIKKIKNRIKKVEGKVNEFKENMKNNLPRNKISETNLNKIQRLCKEFIGLSFKVHKIQVKIKKDRKKVNNKLRRNRVENSAEAQEYVEELNHELKIMKKQKKRVAHLIADCKKVENAVENAVESQKSYSAQQETLILKKYEEVSVKLDEKIKEIKEHCKKIGCSDTLSKGQDNELSRLESEKNDLRFEMIKEQNSIVVFLKEGKIRSSVANKYLEEYERLVINSENVRNRRNVSEKQHFSDKLASMATNNNRRKSKKAFKQREIVYSK